MDKLQIVLYGAATYLAIKSLVSLMSDHERAYKRRVADETTAAIKAAATPPVESTEKPARPLKKAG